MTSHNGDSFFKGRFVLGDTSRWEKQILQSTVTPLRLIIINNIDFLKISLNGKKKEKVEQKTSGEIYYVCRQDPNILVTTEIQVRSTTVFTLIVIFLDKTY